MNANPPSPDHQERMSEIAERFPSLRGKPGVRPFDAEAIAHWGKQASHGEQCAAKFIVAVWAGQAKPKWARFQRGFDIIEAMTVWDHGNRDAFIAWCREVYWP